MWEEKVISGAEEDLDSFYGWFAEHAESLFAKQVDVDLLVLAMVEAVNNAVEHGHDQDTCRLVTVSYSLESGSAFVMVTDQGPGFVCRLPKINEVRGMRGRGLGLIKENTDLMLFNESGNQIGFVKGEYLMERLDADNSVTRLTEGVIVVTELNFESMNRLYHQLSRTCERFHGIKGRRVFLDLRRIRILTSRAWGVIFAEAEEQDVDLIVLFNSGPAIITSARQMGVDQRQEPYDKIKVMPDLEQALKLMETLLRGGQPIDAGH